MPSGAQGSVPRGSAPGPSRLVLWLRTAEGTCGGEWSREARSACGRAGVNPGSRRSRERLESGRAARWQAGQKVPAWPGPLSSVSAWLPSRLSLAGQPCGWAAPGAS